MIRTPCGFSTSVMVTGRHGCVVHAGPQWLLRFDPDIVERDGVRVAVRDDDVRSAVAVYVDDGAARRGDVDHAVAVEVRSDDVAVEGGEPVDTDARSARGGGGRVMTNRRSAHEHTEDHNAGTPHSHDGRDLHGV